MLDIDTGRGKLSADIDLRATDDRDWLRGLVREAHVFVQGYRPGAIAAHGFSPEALAEMRPGIVAVSLSAYGHEGPWAGRRGFDSLVQNASGINVAEAEAAGVPAPKELPAQALDHATGYLMAFGAMMALLRKAQRGRLVARARFARADRSLADKPRPGRERLRLPRADGRGTEGAHQRRGHALRPPTSSRHAAQLSETPAHWTRPPVKLGTHAPVWPV